MFRNVSSVQKQGGSVPARSPGPRGVASQPAGGAPRVRGHTLRRREARMTSARAQPVLEPERPCTSPGRCRFVNSLRPTNANSAQGLVRGTRRRALAKRAAASSSDV